MKKLFSRAGFSLAFFYIAGIILAQAQSEVLQSGPMVGYADMREVMLWVQTKEPASVLIIYWDATKPGIKYRTAVVMTVKDKAYTAHLLADEVEPGKKYTYELYINNKKINRPYSLSFRTQELWQQRKDPPNFKFALGSCNYINDPVYEPAGNPKGGNYEIFPAILGKAPEFMLWLGDNTYLRTPDWNSRTGIFHRYTHTRSIPQVQALLGSVSHYAIWDDHEFGPNDSNRSFIGKDKTLEAFKLFWANSDYRVGGGISSSFTWNDAEFFLLDNRYFRSPNGGKMEQNYLGMDQLLWLIDALTTSKATFKFVAVGGQVLNPAQVYENYSNYSQEREVLLNAIAKAKIPGVIFLDGDRHHSVLTKMDRPGLYPLYDLTVSPLTAAPGKAETVNTMAVPGTFVEERNFGMMDISGPAADRVLTISLYNSSGKELWVQKIKASELK